MPTRRESETAKGKIGMELCPPSESELLEEKKQPGENGESLSNGFSNYRSDPLRNRLSYCDL